jgi:hypothetical protein
MFAWHANSIAKILEMLIGLALLQGGLLDNHGTLIVWMLTGFSIFPPKACLSICLAVGRCRFNIPGMGGREDWGRTDDELMRARGVVDEVLVCLGLAPAHYDENLRARVGVCCCCCFGHAVQWHPQADAFIQSI